MSEGMKSIYKVAFSGIFSFSSLNWCTLCTFYLSGSILKISAEVNKKGYVEYLKLQKNPCNKEENGER